MGGTAARGLYGKQTRNKRVPADVPSRQPRAKSKYGGTKKGLDQFGGLKRY